LFIARRWTSKKKSRKLDESQELISLARKRLQQPQSEFGKTASAWAVELQKMEPQQQLFAKMAINNILFEGQMGTLRRDSVQINNFSRYLLHTVVCNQAPVSITMIHIHYKNNLNTMHKYSSLVLLIFFFRLSINICE